MAGWVPPRKLEDERILVTGAAGSIGSALVDQLTWRRHRDLLPTDVESMDVTRRSSVQLAFSHFKPTLVFHLAGAKHALAGEEDPAAAAKVNITGTRNVLEYAAKHDARVVTASTCKACNPETAYGASKLIAERMTLNAGGSVARFYNVRQSAGNVFELWESLPADAPIPVTPCKRRFMGIDDAVRLLLRCTELPSGRYTVAGTRLESMADVAAALYPNRPQVEIPPRRGDRLEEPEMATHERAVKVGSGLWHVHTDFCRILSPHDMAEVGEQVAA